MTSSLGTFSAPRFLSAHLSDIPVLATAIHDGHDVRPGLEALMALSPAERLREEDPFTGEMISGVPNRIVVHRSRFETDLNRGREACVYTTPDQCWGLELWRGGLDDGQDRASRAFHDEYYALLDAVLKGMERRHGRFVLLDLHSYNHRRAGAEAEPTPPEAAPDINIGTSSMDRQRWDGVVSALIAHFSATPVCGRLLDVRENVAFQGRGEQTRFVHERFPQTGCAVAIEFKKFFMDEWTGEPDWRAVEELKALMASAAAMLAALPGGL